MLIHYLQVANPSVRANAAAILFDVFPLNDSTANIAQSDELLQRQFDVIGVSTACRGMDINVIKLCKYLFEDPD